MIAPVCRTHYQWLLCNCLEHRLQEFRIFMQFPCRCGYGLASAKQVCYGQLSRSFSSRKPPSIFMQILKRMGLVLVWLAGPVFIFVAANKNDPYLISLRGPGNIVLAAASIIAVVVLIRRGHWRRGIAGRLLILLWCLPSLSMLAAHASFEWRKRSVLQTDAAQARSLGRHFIVGYSSFAEVAVLAEKGLISGVYVTRHNIVGSSAARLKEEISALQEKRRAAGLP